jgi:ribosomal protein S27AE
MQQPHNFDPSAPSINKRPCPKCGLPIFLSKIEPADKDDHDQRTFECSTCDYAETVMVRFRKEGSRIRAEFAPATAHPDSLVPRRCSQCGTATILMV